MGPIQIRGTDLADRRWAAVMARWERAHGTDWSERSATGLYSRGDAAKGLGGNFGADTGRRDRAGAADGGYRGALVVCQGGDRADVKLAVTEAVSALTGLSSDRVTVAKCQ